MRGSVSANRSKIIMPSFNRLPDVFAWQVDGRWYYTSDGHSAPGNAVEARHYDDGQGTFLALSRGTHGIFVRDAVPWSGTFRRLGGDQNLLHTDDD